MPTRSSRGPTPAPAPARDRMEWLIAALLLAVGIARAWLVNGLHQLPSAIFGGDYSYEMGCIRSIMASHNPMASCSTCGGLPHYLPLYGTLLALFTAATGLGVVKSMLVMSVVFRMLSVGLVGLVFSRVHGRATGLVMACLWAFYRPQPILKYTEFTTGIVAPLYFLALHRYLHGPTALRAALVGLTLAMAGYSHTVVFIGGSLLAAAMVAVSAATRPSPGTRVRALAAGAGHLAVTGLCASLALGYWWKPIFLYHGHTSAHYLEWTSGSILTTLRDRLEYAGRFLHSFIELSDWPRAVANGLAILGLVCLWRMRSRERFLPGALIAGGTFAYMFHYFVTMPVLHIHFVPVYIAWMLWGFAVLFLAAIPVRLLFDRVSDASDRFALGVIVLAATLVGIVVTSRAEGRDPAVVEARQPMHPMFGSLQAYVSANTKPEDTALSTNELSFAWSALTGRKTVVTRRAHNDPYMDMEARNRDAAIMLYGQDEEARRRLLEHYDVRYLLWISYWVGSEFQADSSGHVHVVDPLLYFSNPGFDSVLTAAGVKVTHANGWVDPAMRNADYPRFDFGIVSPENYTRPRRPWSESFDPLLDMVWTYRENGDTLGALYRIRR